MVLRQVLLWLFKNRAVLGYPIDQDLLHLRNQKPVRSLRDYYTLESVGEF